ALARRPRHAPALAAHAGDGPASAVGRRLAAVPAARAMVRSMMRDRAAAPRSAPGRAGIARPGAAPKAFRGVRPSICEGEAGPVLWLAWRGGTGAGSGSRAARSVIQAGGAGMPEVGPARKRAGRALPLRAGVALRSSVRA